MHLVELEGTRQHVTREQFLELSAEAGSTGYVVETYFCKTTEQEVTRFKKRKLNPSSSDGEFR